MAFIIARVCLLSNVGTLQCEPSPFRSQFHGPFSARIAEFCSCEGHSLRCPCFRAAFAASLRASARDGDGDQDRNRNSYESHVFNIECKTGRSGLCPATFLIFLKIPPSNRKNVHIIKTPPLSRIITSGDEIPQTI